MSPMIARRIVIAQPEYSATPAPEHAVQFYESDRSLIEVLAQDLADALRAGDTVIVNATRKHRNALYAELALRNIDLASAMRAGRFRELDPAECLAKFMVHGAPDKDRFESVMGGVINDAAAALQPGHRLVMFGEMVALLWDEGRREATIRLEELCRDLVRRRALRLLCAYPIRAFDPLKYHPDFSSICGDHTHVNAVAALRLASLCGIAHRRLARLQKKTRALEAEIQFSRQRMQTLQQVTQAGTWELESGSDMLTLSPTAAQVLGYEHVSQVPLSKFFDLMYYSGDREAVWKHVQEAQEHGTPFKVRFRIRRGEGTRVVEMQCRTLNNRDQWMMLGVFTDITIWVS